MSKRGKTQAKSWYPEPALVRKRVGEMNRAFESSFPEQRLPNNGLGRKWAKYMVRTKRLYPGPLDRLWLKSWCPWMTEFGPRRNPWPQGSLVHERLARRAAWKSTMPCARTSGFGPCGRTTFHGNKFS